MSSTVCSSASQNINSGTYVPTILSKYKIYWKFIYEYLPFSIIERVEYGVGSLSKLTDILKELSISRPLIVTGTSLATKTNIVEQVKQATNCDGTIIFSGIQQYSPIENVKEALMELKKNNADGIIAVGGGSPIDAAKLLIFLYKTETGKLLKLISIPTTLSAAEYTVISGYTGINSFDW